MTRSATLNFIATFSGLMSNILDAQESALPKVLHEFKQAQLLKNGVGVNQVDRVWGDNDLFVPTATPVDLDLFDFATIDIGAGVGLDALGQPAGFAKVIGLMVVNKSLTANLDVGNNATAAAFGQPFVNSADPDTAALRIGPGGTLLLINPSLAGYPVTDTSDHLLRLSSDADLNCAVLLAGRSS